MAYIGPQHGQIEQPWVSTLRRPNNQQSASTSNSSFLKIHKLQPLIFACVAQINNPLLRVCCTDKQSVTAAEFCARREKALAIGSEFLGEGVLFTIAVLATAWEYKASNDKAAVGKREQAEREVPSRNNCPAASSRADPLRRGSGCCKSASRPWRAPCAPSTKPSRQAIPSTWC